MPSSGKRFFVNLVKKDAETRKREKEAGKTKATDTNTEFKFCKA